MRQNHHRSQPEKLIPVKTTPENVRESHEGLYHASMNLPAAAKNCGMTEKEMKMTFHEYLKYNQPIEDYIKTLGNNKKTDIY